MSVVEHKHPTKPYILTTDPDKFDLEAVHYFLSRHAYWALGISRKNVERAFHHSLAFALLDKQKKQIGAARLVTDYTTVAYLADVYVLEDRRGEGLGKWMIEKVLEHPKIQGLRRVMLATSDMTTLYEKFGFEKVLESNMIMQISKPGTYPED